MSPARFLFAYVRPYLRWFVVGIAATILYSVTTAVLVSLVGPLFDEVLLVDTGVEAGAAASPIGRIPGVTEPGSGGETHKFGLAQALDDAYEHVKRRFDIVGDEVLYFLPVTFVIIFLLRNLSLFLSDYAFKRGGLGLTTDVRNELYRHVLGQSSRFFSRHSSTEIVSRIVNDIGQMQMTVSQRMVDLLRQPLVIVGLLALLLTTHLPLALACLGALPLIVLPIVFFGKGLRRASFRSQERMADLAEVVAEGVRGHRVVKAFGMEAFEDRRLRAATGRHLRVDLWGQLLSSLSSPVIETVAAFGGAALLVFAGREIRSGGMTASQFFSVLTYLVFLYDPIRKLNKANLALQQSFAAVHRVMAIMAEPNEIVERDAARALAGIGRGIAYEDVSFAYAERGVLHRVGLEIAPGEVVALVGPSGAGKSTLVNLLPRFFDPDSGRVTIDGIDLREVTLESLRGMIALVTQETVLFDESVRYNIAYGRDDLPLERVREAATAAFADEFIEQLPDGYDTVVGEGGLSLSGGQRQRLAIARALLKDAPILILDEATSQLDTESESKVQRALSNLMRGRTTLVIAHRLSTITHADRIVVLREGRIEEQGTHAELIERDGLYKELHDLQFDV